MPICSCGSHNVQSNHISDETMKHVLHAGHVANHSGFRLGGFASLAAVGGMKFLNRQRKAWRCDDCDKRFDD